MYSALKKVANDSLNDVNSIYLKSSSSSDNNNEQDYSQVAEDIDVVEKQLASHIGQFKAPSKYLSKLDNHSIADGYEIRHERSIHFEDHQDKGHQNSKFKFHGMA
jgi:hypothetical protein